MTKVCKIKNLDCANCALKVECKLKKLDGVNDASVNFLTEKLTLDIDENREAEIMKNVEKTCKRVEPDCEVVLK